MTRIIALALAITAGSAALASGSYGAVDQATQDAIRAQLSEQGFEVRKIEADDGKYEAYAIKNGERYEIYLDRDLKVIKTERDD